MKQIAKYVAAMFLFIQIVPAFAIPQYKTVATTQQITKSSAQDNKPLIYKDTIVYERHTSDPTGVDIYSYNLKNKTEAVLVNRAHNQYPSALTERYLLYTEYTDDPIQQYDIRLLDLKTKEDKLLIGGSGTQEGQDMYNNYIAYTDGYGCGDLYFYNLSNKRTTYIASHAYGAKIWGQDIVWYECIGGGLYGIHGYNIARKTQFEISTVNNGYQQTPDIYQHYVVWRDQRNGTDAIYVKNLVRNTETLIAGSSTEIYTYPVISEEYIVWVRDRGTGAHDIMAYNRKSGEILEVSNHGAQPSSPTIPTIYQNKAVWMSWHTGNGDIYMATFKYPTK